MNEITMTVPEHIKDDQALIEFLQANVKQIEDAMDLDVLDSPKSIDQITITGLHYDGDDINIWYDFDYSIYKGCADQNYVSDETDRIVKGKREGNRIIFEKYISPEPRSTADEF